MLGTMDKTVHQRHSGPLLGGHDHHRGHSFEHISFLPVLSIGKEDEKEEMRMASLTVHISDNPLLLAVPLMEGRLQWGPLQKQIFFFTSLGYFRGSAPRPHCSRKLGEVLTTVT